MNRFFISNSFLLALCACSTFSHRAMSQEEGTTTKPEIKSEEMVQDPNIHQENPTVRQEHSGLPIFMSSDQAIKIVIPQGDVFNCGEKINSALHISLVVCTEPKGDFFVGAEEYEIEGPMVSSQKLALDIYPKLFKEDFSKVRVSSPIPIVHQGHAGHEVTMEGMKKTTRKKKNKDKNTIITKRKVRLFVKGSKVFLLIQEGVSESFEKYQNQADTFFKQVEFKHLIIDELQNSTSDQTNIEQTETTS